MNKKMDKEFVLGIDLDGVCCDWLGACAFMAAKEYRLNLWSYLRLPTYPPEIEDLLAKYQFTREMYGWLNPIPRAAKTLCGLQRDIEIVYITGRPLSTKSVTKKWLELHGFPESRVINVRQGKLAAIKRMKVSLFIEDRPRYANPLAEAGIDVVLLDVYARDLSYLHEDIVVAHNWLVVEQIAREEIKKWNEG
jgi:hypothetical protein